MLTELEKSILKVVGYFDLLSYPLTLLEIHKWLEKPADLFEIKKILASEPLIGLISQTDGFYFLTGRDRLAARRLSRYPINYFKLKKAIKIAGWLKFFPYLEAIAVYSSLSLANSRPAGDLDLFIVAQAGRVWTARFFINLFLKIFNLRPNQKTSRDKICVSYLAADGNLDLSVANDGENDFYYRYCGPPNFIFIYEERNQSGVFFEKNSWIKESLPNWYRQKQLKRKELRLGWVKKTIEFLTGLIGEKNYQKFQMAILPGRYKKIMNLDRRVMINDGLIKLHDNESRRQEFNRLFQEKFQKLIYEN